MAQQPDGAFAEVDGFSWARGTILGDAACLTLTEPATADAVARAFGGDPAQVRELRLDEAAEELAEGPWVALRPVGTWILAVELNGWQGSRPEVLERVSAGGRAVSAYWNVNGQTQFSYAAAGQVLTAFDAVFPERRTGADPDVLASAGDGLPWAGALPVPLLLALLARVTGSPLDPSWLDGTWQVFPIEALAEAVDAGIDPDTEELTYDHPLLAWQLRHATGPGQRAAALGHAAAAARWGLAGSRSAVSGNYQNVSGNAWPSEPWRSAHGHDAAAHRGRPRTAPHPHGQGDGQEPPREPQHALRPHGRDHRAGQLSGLIASRPRLHRLRLPRPPALAPLAPLAALAARSPRRCAGSPCCAEL
jgi:hypothetical protein